MLQKRKAFIIRFWVKTKAKATTLKYAFPIFLRMKWLSAVLFLALLAGNAGALEFGTLESKAQEYARQYETGAFNYLQLYVHLNLLREEVYNELFDEEYQGNEPPAGPDAEVFRLMGEGEAAYRANDHEKVLQVLNALEAAFKERGQQENVKTINQMRQALQEKDVQRLEFLARELDDSFRQEKRRETFEGIAKEKVEALFGQPTRHQDRVWVQNLNRDVKVQQPVPAWEKKVFSGDKIQVVFNAYPHLVEYSDTLNAYYWVDIQVSFKKNLEPLNASQVMQETRERVKAYYATPSNAQDLAAYIVKQERAFNETISVQGESCQELLQTFFNDPGNTAVHVEWKGTLPQGLNETATLYVDESVNPEWHGFNMWLDARMEGPGAPSFQPLEPIDRDAVFRLPVQENGVAFKSLFLEVKQNLSFNNVSSAQQKMFELQEQLNVLNEKANREEEGFTIAHLTLLLESLFNEHTQNFSKEQVNALEFKELLFKDSIQRVNAYCSGQSNWCGEGFSCSNATCVSAKGGNETCDNGIDDDEDNITDCQDPDCVDFLACGRACESACNVPNGCWDCHTQNCREPCDACSSCTQVNGQDSSACTALCTACGDCATNSCSQPCDSCWTCENNYYGDGCREECKSCDACNASGAQDCGSTCSSCNTCKYNAGSFQCSSPHVFDSITGQCACPAVSCPEGQFQDGYSCACIQNPSAEPIQTPVNEPVSTCTLSCAEGEQLDETACTCNPINAQTAPSKTPLFPFFNPISPSIFTGLVTIAEPENAQQSTQNACASITCSPYQACNPSNGYCECTSGHWDCDGDWINGCESAVSCQPCTSDLDCARTRCSEDRFSVETFSCKQGDSWEETIAEFQLGGRCETRVTGEKKGNVWLNGWGKNFSDLERFKQEAYAQTESDWCAQELNDNVKERVELQNALNTAFMEWFFSEFVSSNPNQYMFHEEALRFVYDALQRNTEDTARNLHCMRATEWPKEFAPVNVSFSTPNGKIRIWEEFTRTSFWGEDQPILSPYMELWIFPGKEQFKKMFQEEIVREGPKGPTPAEVDEMRQNPEVMESIGRISDSFGGEAKILFEIKDESQSVVRMQLTMNKTVLVRMDFLEPSTQTENVDATIIMPFDFFYDTMSSIIRDMQGSHTIKPHWEQNEFYLPEIDDSLIAFNLFGKILWAIPSGQIRVEPITAIPNVLLSLTTLLGFMQFG